MNRDRMRLLMTHPRNGRSMPLKGLPREMDLTFDAWLILGLNRGYTFYRTKSLEHLNGLNLNGPVL